MSTLQVDNIISNSGSTPDISGIDTGDNMLINGDFNVNFHIEKTSPVTASGYITDRWRISSGNGSTTYSYDDVNKPAGAHRSLVLSGTGTIRQGIEIRGVGNAGQFTLGSVFTLSLWCDRDLTGESVTCALTDAVGSISGGNSNGNTPGIFAEVPGISSSNGFTKYYANITIDATPSATTLCFAFALPSTDDLGGGTIRYSMIQFESGSSASKFKHRSVAEETMLAARYYQEFDSFTATIIKDSATLGQNKGLNIPLRNSMRVAPTVTYTHSNFTGPGSNNTFIVASKTSVRIISTNANPGGTSNLSNIELDAEL